jgi:branched-chain amino acid transport system permease protein
MDAIRRYRTPILTGLAILIFLAITASGMSASTAVSILLSGITLGALYFLVASGLSLIFAGWTFYTNPRLILNTVPILIILTAGILLGPVTGRLMALPRVARWLAALLALAVIILAMRGFPLDKLVAMGMTMSGKVIATADAEEPLITMFARLGLAFLAGILGSAAIGARRHERPAASPLRTLITVAGLALLAIVTLIFRGVAEQSVLGMESSVRFVLALGVGAGTGAVLGALMEWGLIRPLYARPMYQILLTLGLVFVSDQVVRLVWGPAGAFMEIPSLFTSTSTLCPASDLLSWLGNHCDSILVLGRPFPSYRLFIIAIGVVIAVAVAILMQRSRLGMIIRAGVQDSEMVEALGINVRRVFTIVFAIGAGLAGLGGVVAAPFLGVYPGMAMEFLLQAFIVVVIGGLGSLPGAAVGALLVGVARAYGDHIVLAGIQLPGMVDALTGSPAIARASTVLIMAVVLFIKPTGIFGKKE